VVCITILGVETQRHPKAKNLYFSSRLKAQGVYLIMNALRAVLVVSNVLVGFGTVSIQWEIMDGRKARRMTHS
jgi:hypothetical protein